MAIEEVLGTCSNERLGADLLEAKAPNERSVLELELWYRDKALEMVLDLSVFDLPVRGLAAYRTDRLAILAMNSPPGPDLGRTALAMGLASE